MGEDLFAVVSVDGVNVVSGETASVRQSGYVLDPWRGVRIRGWRKSLDEIASFYFTSLVHEVAFERASDEPAETITIYYDSYRNLVAQGVLAAPATPRDPSPFPTRFVPDPPR